MKFATSSSNSCLTVYGPINCQTGPYRMAVFTAKDDDTVGQQITGSTGNPTNYYGNPALVCGLSGLPVTLGYLRISYANYAYSFTGPLTNCLKHSQFIHDNTAVVLNTTTLSLQNVLFNNISGDVVLADISTISALNVTVDGANTFFDDAYASTLYLTNSLLVSITNTGSAFNSAYSYTNLSDPGVFQTAGAGAHYLSASSPYTNAGTTNIDPALLADLRNMTCYPPLWLTNTIATNTTLVPLPIRDTNAAPDLGYHYVPVDYLSSCIVTNATLTLTNGVALAYYNNYGVWLQNSSQLVSQGSPIQRDWLVYYNLVQEQTNCLSGTNYALVNSLAIVPYHTNFSQNPSVSLRLTTLCAPQGAEYILYLGDSWIVNNLSFRDCELYGAGSGWYEGSDTGTVIDFENNLFQYIEIFNYSLAQITTHNNLYRGD